MVSRAISLSVSSPTNAWMGGLRPPALGDGILRQLCLQCHDVTLYPRDPWIEKAIIVSEAPVRQYEYLPVRIVAKHGG